MKQIVVIMLLGLAFAATAAEELPEFRKGMWEFNRTIDAGTGQPQVIKLQRCVSPTDDMREQNRQLVAAGCKATDVVKNGNVYSFTADCTIQGETMQSKSVVTVDGDSGYRAEVETIQGPVMTRESLVARRVGDCENE